MIRVERSKARKSKQFLRGSVAIYDQFQPWQLGTVDPVAGRVARYYQILLSGTIYPVWLAGRVVRYRVW